MEFINDFLNRKKEDGSLRFLRAAQRRGNGKIVYEDKEYWDLSSNDYLGLSHAYDLKSASAQAIEQWGTGSSASRLLSGSLELHHILEEKTAEFKEKEAALVFNSGFQANLGLIPALCQKGDIIFSDKLNHASIIDGIRLSEADFARFAHNDINDLRRLLDAKRVKYNNAWIITETVFSMDGDICPLKEIIGLKNEYNCKLIVDEAHATGIFGNCGGGFVQELNAACDVEIIMGTFSKALGSFGAYIAADKQVADLLVNASRSFIFSTALPPSVIAANIAAIEYIQQRPENGRALLAKAQYLRSELITLGFDVRGNSQIVPVIIGDNHKTIAFADKLKEKGYWVMPVREPTVPRGTARLRLTVTHDHTYEMIKELVKHFSVFL